MNKPIYALSGYAECFWLMAKNWKDIENRDWSLTRYIKPADLPVRIYLHASRTPASRGDIDFIHRLIDGERWEDFMAVDWESIRGSIIGDITIIGQIKKIPGLFNTPLADKYAKSRWFFGEYGFVVKDGQLYDKPIPCRGRLGFFKPDIPGSDK